MYDRTYPTLEQARRFALGRSVCGHVRVAFMAVFEVNGGYRSTNIAGTTGAVLVARNGALYYPNN